MYSELFNQMSDIMELLFTFDTLIALIIGVVGGLIIGALPGLSANMGIALMLPMTYGMSPTAAIILLMSIYTSAITGGSISAILLHTPGTPSSAATAIDGYQLTLQGKGLKALGVSIITSSMGGIFSAIALLLLAPPLARLSLQFSSPEYFLMACFGLTVIASLASNSLIKGITSGAIGLLIGVIGVDAVSAYPRYTFGSMELLNGIPLVPVLIGVFAIPQILSQVEEFFSGKSSEKKVVGDLKGSMLPSKSEMKMLVPTIIRSSFIGLFIGILPGAGGSIGSWVSYNTGKRFAKNKDLYGKGSLEGLAASESANNAVTGGSLIPMMTLGIPGSSAAAIILGGLMIQGLQPGAKLFTEQASVAYSVIFGFLIASILMGVFGLLISKMVINVTNIPVGILTPIVCVLAVIGSYAGDANIFNIYVMAASGIFGYFLLKTNFSAPGIVLGLILGSIAEIGYRQSVVMARGNVIGYYLSRPMSVMLIILIIITVGFPIVNSIRNKRKYDTDTADISDL